MTSQDFLRPSPYQCQCSFSVNWILVNALQWNLNQNTNIFIHENALIHWARWRIYASLSWAIIGSGNDMSPVRRQAIRWTTNAVIYIYILLLIVPSGTNFKWNFNQNQNIFIEENILFSNAVYKMAPVFSRSQYAKCRQRNGSYSAQAPTHSCV